MVPRFWGLKVRLESIRRDNRDKIKCHVTRQLSVSKIFSILELKSGTVYMETCDTNDDGVETVELLVSRDRKYFTLISRTRSGGNYHPMQSYNRDYEFPLHSKVKV
jgi:hypothetical protein